MTPKFIILAMAGSVAWSGACAAAAQVSGSQPDGPIASARVDETAAQIQAFIDERPAPGSTLVAPVVVPGRRAPRVAVDDSPWGQGLYTAVAPGVDAATAMATPSAAPPLAPRQIHGEVSAAVGTHGLRAASAAVVVPVGEDATLGLAISSARWGR